MIQALPLASTRPRVQAPRDGVRHAPTRAGARWLATVVAVTVVPIVLLAIVAPRHGLPIPLGLLLFVGYALHLAATGWLARLEAVRACARHRPWRFVVVPAALVVLFASVLPLLGSTATQGCLELIFCWQLFHYTKQNLGVANLASTSQGAGPLRPTERRCLLATGWCGIAALLARPSLLHLGAMPASTSAFNVARSGVVAAVVVGLVALARRPRAHRPLGVVACFATMLCFTAPMYLVSSPAGAIGGMTIAHGLQYLAIVGLIAVRPGERLRRRRRVVSLGIVAILGGLAIRTTTQLVVVPGVGRSFFGLYLGLLAAHFVIDAGLWRLRDPTSRAFVHGALPDLVGVAPSHPADVPTSTGADI